MTCHQLFSLQLNVLRVCHIASKSLFFFLVVAANRLCSSFHGLLLQTLLECYCGITLHLCRPRGLFKFVVRFTMYLTVLVRMSLLPILHLLLLLLPLFLFLIKIWCQLFFVTITLILITVVSHKYICVRLSSWHCIHNKIIVRTPYGHVLFPNLYEIVLL